MKTIMFNINSINANGRMITKDTKITIPRSLPIFYEYNYNNPIGIMNNISREEDVLKGDLIFNVKNKEISEIIKKNINNRNYLPTVLVHEKKDNIVMSCEFVSISFCHMENFND